MKRNIIVPVLIIAVLALVLYYFMKGKGKTKTRAFQKLFSSENEDQQTESPDVRPKNMTTNHDFFRKKGFSYDYLTRLSNKDAAIARNYVENYMQKGIKMLPNNTLWKDVVRIASATNLFPKPTFEPILNIH